MRGTTESQTNFLDGFFEMATRYDRYGLSGTYLDTSPGTSPTYKLNTVNSLGGMTLTLTLNMICFVHN